MAAKTVHPASMMPSSSLEEKRKKPTEDEKKAYRESSLAGTNARFWNPQQQADVHKAIMDVVASHSPKKAGGTSDRPKTALPVRVTSVKKKVPAAKVAGRAHPVPIVRLLED